MYRIGVDLGGTNIAVGVVDDQLKIVGRGKMKTNAPRSAAAIFDDIAAACRMAAQEAGIAVGDAVSIGIGAPGSIDKADGMIVYANNFDFYNVPARELLQERLGNVPVYLDNDANCAALGEAVVGAGNGAKDFVAITLGTGVGSGIVVDGKLVTGVNYAAGEMGHMVICIGGERCNCGRRGCWESYSSATALIRHTRDAMRRHPDSLMWDIVGDDIMAVNGRTAFDAMRQGDATAKELVDRYIYYLAIGITNVVNTFQPEVICLGGGIAHEGETLLVPLRRIVSSVRYTKFAAKQTQIVAAKLGNDAGIYGAALLDC